MDKPVGNPLRRGRLREPEAPPRILMLAPEPFFEPRGTPFSEYHRIKALSELGYRIDLVTYPFGRDVALPGLRIYRCPRPPLLRGVRIGPSAAKILLDLLLTATAARLAHARLYDAVHSHEEAGVAGICLAEWLGVPHLYDMHSSLPQQLDNFGYDRSTLVRRLFEWAETLMVTRSRAIITICQELQDTAAALGAADRASLIENVMGGDFDDGAPPRAREIRARYGIDGDRPLVLYTGTFEAYQGLDLLIEAAAVLGRTHPDARILVVGGTPAQVALARGQADGAASNLVFAGQRPPEEIPGFVEECDILVSPRTSGTNTPLKIYSYLRSGRPIVATRLRTHTQVLDPETALLVAPRAAALAAGLARLIDDPGERERLATAARALASARYGRKAYVTRTAAAYERLLGRPVPASGEGPAPPGP
ncbi:MAG: glycosyltransferase [Acidobacteria bacterium]|nr:glycosyltransferase [Acidobacteriota bacterium]